MERAGFNYKTLFLMHHIFREQKVYQIVFKPCLFEAKKALYDM